MSVQSLDQLIFSRMIQAIGVGMVAAMSGAIIRDYYEGQQAAQMFTLIGLIMMIAPLIGPTIGATIHHLLGWRFIFAFLGMYALIIFMVQIKHLPQKTIIPKQQQSWSQISHDVLARYAHVFKTHIALGFLFFQAFSFSAMFCFLIESPFVYLQYFKLSEFHYTALFALNLTAMMTFNRITAWQLKKGTPSHQILRWGVIIQCLLNISLFSLAFFVQQPPLWLFATMVSISIGTQGFIGANTQACFMQFFKAEGGSANGVLLSSQALITAGVGYLTTQLHNNTIHIMPMMMMCCSLIGAILLWAFSRKIWHNHQ